MPLTLASGDRLPVDAPQFWRCVARRAAAAMEPWAREVVKAGLLLGCPVTRLAARDAAELVLRTAPGRLSIARGTGEAMLAVMSLDWNPEARRAFARALVEALGREGDCNGR